jgi:hypothetical protein
MPGGTDGTGRDHGTAPRCQSRRRSTDANGHRLRRWNLLFSRGFHDAVTRAASHGKRGRRNQLIRRDASSRATARELRIGGLFRVSFSTDHVTSTPGPGCAPGPGVTRSRPLARGSALDSYRGSPAWSLNP